MKYSTNDFRRKAKISKDCFSLDLSFSIYIYFSEFLLALYLSFYSIYLSIFLGSMYSHCKFSWIMHEQLHRAVMRRPRAGFGFLSAGHSSLEIEIEPPKHKVYKFETIIFTRIVSYTSKKL